MTRTNELRRTPFLREAADPYCIEPIETAGLLVDVPWKRLAVIGDSIAAGAREPADGYRDMSFAERIGHALAATHAGFAYVNLARSDARLRDVYDGQLEEALRFDPDVVLVVAGGNDALRADFDAARARVELVDVLAALRTAGAQPVTVGLFDLPRSGLVPAPHAVAMAERFDRLDAVTRAVAAEQDAIHVNTHHHPLAADPGIFSADGIHANARGHAVAAAAIATALADGLPG